MPITLQISSELEKELRREAKKKGMQLDLFLAKYLEKSFLYQKRKDILIAKESDLLQSINAGYPPEFWAHYKGLVKKRQLEIISPAELNELSAISNQLEFSNANRLKCLSELANIRKTTLPALIEEMGIKPMPVGQ